MNKKDDRLDSAKKLHNHHKAATAASLACVDEVMQRFHAILKNSTAVHDDNKIEYLTNIIKMKWIDKLIAMKCLDETSLSGSSLIIVPTAGAVADIPGRPKPFMTKPTLLAVNPGAALFSYLNLRPADPSQVSKYKRRRLQMVDIKDDENGEQDEDFNKIIDEIDTQDFDIDELVNTETSEPEKIELQEEPNPSSSTSIEHIEHNIRRTGIRIRISGWDEAMEVFREGLLIL
jgi:hypothetical protein